MFFSFLPILKSCYGNPIIAVKAKVKSLSRVRLFATSWTVAYQAPPSVGFSRQEYWSGLPFPSPGDLLDPGIEPRSPADTLRSEPPGKAPGKENSIRYLKKKTKNRSAIWSYKAIPGYIFEENHNLKRHTHPQCSFKHCLQYLRHGSNLNVYWQMNG